ncbi:ATP-binding cassette domain-containing protein [Catenovulum sp. SX2]|uniref:branched-chain amino acid ABC transporter ATP-binding protein/permease n=1 Tax=Catenovulum sp. SX2 TaxID=3398614 RepID=UPI003F8721A8
MRNNPLVYSIISILALIGCTLSFALDSYSVLVFTLCLSSAIVGVGLNILMGLSGQISFGHIAFYAIGAYVSALLLIAGVPLSLSIIVAGLACAAIGALLAIPAIRVNGPYLAMITIAFAFVVHHGLMEWKDLTGGANGLMGIPMPESDTISSEVLLALLSTIILTACLIFYHLLHSSGWGKAIRAVKASEIAAKSIGFNPVQTKTLAFALSALLTGLAGAIIPPLVMFISPSTFPFFQSILFVLTVIIGGTATLFGPLFGAVVVVLTPEFLSPLAEYRLLIFAVLLLCILWIAPKGILGSIQSKFQKTKVSLPPKSTNRHLLAKFFDRVQNEFSQLSVNDIGIRFGGVQAAKDISFNANLGEVTSIIGPNGAGKTTVLNMISGFYTPDSGTIQLAEALEGKNAWQISRAGIARTYQTTQLFGDMTVLENLLAAMQNGHIGHPLLSQDGSNSELAMNLLSFVGFKGNVNIKAEQLAHVDKRLVEIARALATRPWVLLLDEPAAGLSRHDTDKMAELIQQIAKFGIAVILVEHDMPLVMHVSDKILVLDAGKPIALDTPEKIRVKPEVINAYLGCTDYQAPPRSIPWDGSRDATLFVKNLTVDYGAAPVLEDVNFVVNPGELVAILGANGAGKSSILTSLAGLHPCSKGEIVFNNQSIEQLNASDIAKLGLALVPEGRQLFAELSVRDNILLGAYSRLDTVDEEQELESILARFPRLRDRIDSQAGLLSGGEQQMVAVGRGLMAKPKVLLLDEPSLGLAPAMIAELYDALAELRDEGVTILLVDQMANLALQVADRAYILETGQITKQGKAAELLADPDLEAAYLGETA